MTIKDDIKKLGQQAKEAANVVAKLNSAERNQAIFAMAEVIEKSREELLTINQEEVQKAQNRKQAEAFVDRLRLNNTRIDAMVSGLKAIAELPDPLGRILAEWTVPSGLHIKRVAIPLGVIGVIYESRPNVTADAAALCLKAGNAVLLRGGSECAKTNQAILRCLQEGLRQSKCPQQAIQTLPDQSREAVGFMLGMHEYIDVIIPRGGRSLVKRVMEESRIPLFQHLDGLCHTYIHKAADQEMAINILVNAKLRRPGICGATETLLIDEAVAGEFMPDIVDALHGKGCELRGCPVTVHLDARVQPAQGADWSTEYLDKILSIRVVRDFDEAIAHIKQYSSSHTEAIVTSDAAAARQFMKSIDSAIVMHNASTQFADGGEFGMGAEIGIATGKLHARGPVGVEQLTTFHYEVEGKGQIRPE